LKLFLVKEELFARGKDEFSSAIYALQYSIRKFHGRFPYAGNPYASAMCTRGPAPFPCLVLLSTTVHISNEGADPGRGAIVALPHKPPFANKNLLEGIPRNSAELASVLRMQRL
jgi:hypothetical protein